MTARWRIRSGRRSIAAEPEAGPAPEVFGISPACLVHGGTVAIEHRRLALAQRDWAEHYELTPADRVLQTAPAESVVFTADWIRALCPGATLVLAARDFGTDRTAAIAELAGLLDEQWITVLECEAHLAAGSVTNCGNGGPARSGCSR